MVGGRKKWYEAVKVVRDWYKAQAYNLQMNLLRSHFGVFIATAVANKSTNELQKIKLELLEKVAGDSRILMILLLGGALEKYDKFSKNLSDIRDFWLQA